MPLDWQDLLDSKNVEYKVEGNGNLAVACPFCARTNDPDPSRHMLVSTRGKGWHCWRVDDHRGKNPIRLVQALLNCSWQEAVALCGGQIEPGWDARVKDLLLAPRIKSAEPIESLTLPPEFKSFTKDNAISSPYIGYLRARGFDWKGLTEDYQVYFATQDKFKGRIIFTVRYNENLVGWTGRTIWQVGRPRYLSQGTLPQYLLWFDQLMNTNAHTLYICEGPFDALRINTLGQKHGIAATCLFTSRLSPVQAELLFELLPRFDNRYILLDNEDRTIAISLRMKSELTCLGVHAKRLPPEIDDPAQLDEEQLLAL